MVLVGGGAPEVGGNSSGFMCMRRSWCGGDLLRCVSQIGRTALIRASNMMRYEVVAALKAAGAKEEEEELDEEQY